MNIFQKVLIANRGEIACRIIKTLKKLNIKSVAIYSKADKGALFTELADEAFEIGEAAAHDSYLNIDKIVTLCKQAKVDAVHPGFGFLAENHVFATKLQENNIIFIGPDPKHLKLLGDKIEAKRVAFKLEIPMLSGTLEPVSDETSAKRLAQELGFPVLIKAVAGGGGKGMRRAYSADELKEQLERAQSEAKSSFGDERVFIEKFVEKPRHIEIQILADRFGNIVYLGERECSLQRRYQKVIEEAPSPFIDEPLRKALGEASLKIAKEVGYVSAGTVEFLVDQNKNFYFLEVNPRIQVEHPVTELVTGIDIVEEMIRIAQGEPLKINQKEVSIRGHAIEVRLCAEDPLRDFMPSIGRIKDLFLPKENGIRIDSGIVEGSEITPFYDSMIAKAILWKETRQDAIKGLINYLDQCVIQGVQHNIAFLQSLLMQKGFQEGDFSTKLIEEHYPNGFSYQKPELNDLENLYKIASFHNYLQEKKWNPCGMSLSKQWILFDEDVSISVSIDPTSEQSCDIQLNDSTISAISLHFNPLKGLIESEVQNQSYCVQIEQSGIDTIVRWRNTKLILRILPSHIASHMRFMPPKKDKDLSRYVVSPMPGLLLSLRVSEGDIVKSGEPLAVIEAMKMENVIRATREGKIIKLHVHPGQSLKAEQPMIEFESVA